MLDGDPCRQIDEIHRRLALTTGFRGFHPTFVLSVAALAAATTVCIQVFHPAAQADELVLYAWVGVAALIVLLTALTVVLPALRSESRFAREAAKGVSMQLAPFLAVGLAASILLISGPSPVLWIVPALWSTFMGLGIVSMMPYLPASVAIAALWYLMGAVILYRVAPDNAGELNRAVGITFAGGHVLTALLLREGGRS